jgi:hypothetical protein
MAAKLLRESLMLQKKLGVRLESLSCNFHETARNQIFKTASTNEGKIKNFKNVKRSKESRSNIPMC